MAHHHTFTYIRVAELVFFVDEGRSLQPHRGSRSPFARMSMRSLFNIAFRFDHMEKNNVMLMAVATAVIAIVLLGSWAYMGNDEDSSEYRDPVVGDVKELEITRDGVKSTMSWKAIAELEDGYIIQQTLWDGTVSNFLAKDLSAVGPGAIIEQPMELVGNETIDTVFGEKDCEVWAYQMSLGGTVMDCRAWNAGEVTYRVDMTSPDGTVISSVLKESSVMEGSPSKADDYAVRNTFQAGDRIGYNTTQTYAENVNENYVSEFIVESVDPATLDLVVDIILGEGLVENVKFTDAGLREFVFRDDPNGPVKAEFYSCLGGIVEGYVFSETKDLPDSMAMGLPDGMVMESTVWTDFSGLIHALYIEVYDGNGQFKGTSIITLDHCTLVEEI